MTPPIQGFIAIPGVVAVLTSVVAGAIAGIAALGLDLGTGASIAIGAAAFVLALGTFVAWAVHAVGTLRGSLVSRFPTPPAQGD